MQTQPQEQLNRTREIINIIQCALISFIAGIPIVAISIIISTSRSGKFNYYSIIIPGTFGLAVSFLLHRTLRLRAAFVGWIIPPILLMPVMAGSMEAFFHTRWSEEILPLLGFIAYALFGSAVSLIGVRLRYTRDWKSWAALFCLVAFIGYAYTQSNR